MTIYTQLQIGLRDIKNTKTKQNTKTFIIYLKSKTNRYIFSVNARPYLTVHSDSVNKSVLSAPCVLDRPRFLCVWCWDGTRTFTRQASVPPRSHIPSLRPKLLGVRKGDRWHVVAVRQALWTVKIETTSWLGKSDRT